MSITQAAARGGAWLGVMRLTTQIVTWAVTIIVARLLTPEDYGLMAMAGMFTGYAAVFSELGLGSSIVQRKELGSEELSSVFWLAVLVGFIFAGIAFALAYPTAWVFDERRVIPITELIAVVFVISGFVIVPRNLLARNIKFKEIGIIHFISGITSSAAMLIMAVLGFGVWTLVLGTIVLRLSETLLSLHFCRWRPQLHFNLKEVKQMLTFGANVASARSVLHLFDAGVTFLVGRILGPNILGYYTFSMRLAKIPRDRIISIISQVSFAVFSRFQHDRNAIGSMYIKLTKYINLTVAPLFLAGTFFAPELIPTLLGEQWVPIVFFFQVMCFGLLLTSSMELNCSVALSEGRSGAVLRFFSLHTALMICGILATVNYGFNALSIPWITLSPLLWFGWTYATLRLLGISPSSYTLTYLIPIVASCLVMFVVRALEFIMKSIQIYPNIQLALVQEVLVVSCLYLLYVLFFERKSMRELLLLLKGR